MRGFPIRATVGIVALATLAGGCFFSRAHWRARHAERVARARARAAERRLASLQARLERRRAAVAAAPSSPRAAMAFASLVRSLIGGWNRLVASPMNRKALVDEAIRYLRAAAAKRPEERHVLLARMGTLLLQAGRTNKGVAALRASLAARPTIQGLRPLLARLGAQKRFGEVRALCRRMRPAMGEPGVRYQLLGACLRHSDAASVEGGLSWTTGRDVAFYRRERSRRSEEAARRRAIERERAEVRWARHRQQRLAERSCRRQCQSVGSMCRAACGNNFFCRSRCNSDVSRCRWSCR